MSSLTRAPLVDYAPAKVNLTLRVLGRRRDGYHAIESLVVFARLRDRLTLFPGGPLKLIVRGPTAAAAGRIADNLVLKAARALAAEIDGLTLGRFTLVKNLPVAAGLGGGSTDVAAALRLLARANRLKRDDPRMLKVARSIGADVPVCLDPRARLIRGIGEVLSEPLDLPALAVVLVNPSIAVATKDVFAAFDIHVPQPHPRSRRAGGAPSSLSSFRQQEGERVAGAKLRPGEEESAETEIPQEREALLAFLAAGSNDLEATAIALAPPIAKVLAALRATPGCRLARMSGSGATGFGLFLSSRAAAAAARDIKSGHPRWWVRASVLG